MIDLWNLLKPYSYVRPQDLYESVCVERLMQLVYYEGRNDLGHCFCVILR